MFQHKDLCGPVWCGGREKLPATASVIGAGSQVSTHGKGFKQVRWKKKAGLEDYRWVGERNAGGLEGLLVTG